jgi:hypothetical protein
VNIFRESGRPHPLHCHRINPAVRDQVIDGALLNAELVLGWGGNLVDARSAVKDACATSRGSFLMTVRPAPEHCGQG